MCLQVSVGLGGDDHGYRISDLDRRITKVESVGHPPSASPPISLVRVVEDVRGLKGMGWERHVQVRHAKLEKEVVMS